MAKPGGDMKRRRGQPPMAPEFSKSWTCIRSSDKQIDQDQVVEHEDADQSPTSLALGRVGSGRGKAAARRKAGNMCIA
jgi:hypothetical protein